MGEEFFQEPNNLGQVKQRSTTCTSEVAHVDLEELRRAYAACWRMALAYYNGQGPSENDYNISMAMAMKLGLDREEE